jgi:hypothetical protein
VIKTQSQATTKKGHIILSHGSDVWHRREEKIYIHSAKLIKIIHKYFFY